MIVVAHTFNPQDLVGGSVVLDFINTVTARDTVDPLDWLDSYARLTEWAALAGVLEPRVSTMMKNASIAAPGRARKALHRARGVRETLHAVLAAIASNQAPLRGALDEFGRAWKAAASRASFVESAGMVTLQPEGQRAGLELIVDKVLIEAGDLMKALPGSRLKICIGQRCGWLFLDSSKAGRRVWCDMATCGNAAKARRYAQGKGK
jgi:predicted RNA-binding Zn ribbon-like protein